MSVFGLTIKLGDVKTIKAEITWRILCAKLFNLGYPRLLSILMLIWQVNHQRSKCNSQTNKHINRRTRINICTLRASAFGRRRRMRHCPPDVLRSHAISQPPHSHCAYGGLVNISLYCKGSGWNDNITHSLYMKMDCEQEKIRTSTTLLLPWLRNFYGAMKAHKKSKAFFHNINFTSALLLVFLIGKVSN